MTCPLCDLSNKQLVYQDDYCFAMVISEPLKDGHLMVLPKRHVESLTDLNPEESQAILKLLGRLDKTISEAYDEEPIIFMNLGGHSTQPHIHFHILPSKGGLRHLFSEYEKLPFRKAANSQERKRIGDKIRKSFK